MDIITCIALSQWLGGCASRVRAGCTCVALLRRLFTVVCCFAQLPPCAPVRLVCSAFGLSRVHGHEPPHPRHRVSYFWQPAVVLPRFSRAAPQSQQIQDVSRAISNWCVLISLDSYPCFVFWTLFLLFGWKVDYELWDPVDHQMDNVCDISIEREPIVPKTRSAGVCPRGKKYIRRAVSFLSVPADASSLPLSLMSSSSVRACPCCTACVSSI